MSCGRPKASARLDTYSRWLNHINATRNMIESSTEAFYRQYGRLPTSIDELENSQWLMFEPVPPDNQPLFDFVDRDLESYEEDGDKIKITYDFDGYEFAYYTIAAEGAGQPHIVDALSNTHAANSYGSLIQTDMENENSDITDPDFIRQKLVHALVRQFARRYFEEHLNLPRDPADLIRGYWTPRTTVISNLPTYETDQPHWVYIGVAHEDDNEILYIEIVRPDSTVVSEQWVFKVSTQDNTTSVHEYRLTDDDEIERDVTEPFIDASQPGWGLL